MLSLDYSRRFDLSLFIPLQKEKKKNRFLFTDDEKLLNFQLMVAASIAVFLVLNFSWLSVVYCFEIVLCSIIVNKLN